MRRPVCIVLGIAISAISFLGCAVYPGTARPACLEDLRGEEGWLLLDTVPFVPQVSEKGCGAACLAMVLDHWGDGPSVESLEMECGGAGMDGIRASALRDVAKRRGLSAYLFQGCVADLQHELLRGRPIVVGVVKPHGEEFTAHFVVVVGLHSRLERIAALDPAIGLTSDSLAGFENEWRPAKGVTLVVFLPESKAILAGVDVLEKGDGR